MSIKIVQKKKKSASSLQILVVLIENDMRISQGLPVQNMLS